MLAQLQGEAEPSRFRSVPIVFVQAGRGYMKRNSLILLAAVAATALSVASAKAQDIVVSVAGPMTGGDAVFGEQLKRGAEMAIADINAAGGLMGKKLKLEIGDDQCEPKQALPVA